MIRHFIIFLTAGGSAGTASLFIQLGNDRVDGIFQNSLLLGELLGFGPWVFINPVQGSLASLFNGGFFIIRQLTSHLSFILDLVAESVGIVFETVTGFNQFT
eukprot:Lithocolla_globosa_v1_NODE_6320_length_1104_cov_615.124881.p4 type:complete len:102 gc:universal NODE_6320_length_1104_cov_615.124881:947-642(-)